MQQLVRTVIAGILLVANAPTSAAAQSVDDESLRSVLVERIDGRKWGTAVVVGISSPQGRRVVAYGTMSLTDGRKVDGSTVFEIASLTKVFTALSLAEMAGRGKLSADAPVATCLPASAKIPQHGGRQMTFVDLATHTSGLPLRPTNLASQEALNKYAGYTVQQLYAGLATFVLPREPGTQFEYSNWAFGLLGQALAHCAGQSYEALLAERITGPLGMRDTGFATTARMKSHLAGAYDDELRPMPNQSLGALNGSGGLYSSVDDLLRFIGLFVGQGPKNLVAAAATMVEPRRPGDDPQTRMGLGWRVTTTDGLLTLWSSGRADGYRSYMAFDPKARVAVVALTNAATNTGVDDIGRHLLDPRRALIRAHTWITVPVNVLDRYVGRYKFEDGNYLTVVRDGDQLITQMTGQGPIPILATGQREFYPEDIEAQIVFAESGSGPAQSLVLNQDGQSWKAERVVEETRP